MLMICSLKFKNDVIFKMLLWILCFWFWSYALSKLFISLPLWIKLTMGELLLFFLCNFSSFLSYAGGILVTNHFSLLLIGDRYILAIQQIITHEKHLRYSFSTVSIFWTASEALTPWSYQQKVAKTTLLFWCMLCTANPVISSSSENILTARLVFPDYLSVSYDYVNTKVPK